MSERARWAKGIDLVRGRSASAVVGAGSVPMVVNDSAGTCLALLGTGLSVGEAVDRIAASRGVDRVELERSVFAVMDLGIERGWLSTSGDVGRAVDVEVDLSAWWDEPGLHALAAIIDDRRTTVGWVRQHRVERLAHDRWFAVGDTRAEELAVDAERAAFVHALHRQALHEIVRTVDQQVVVLKGIEVASYYPWPVLRGDGDIDVTAVHADAAHAALIAAGWTVRQPEIDYSTHHHLHPLASPDGSVVVEVHRRPTWPGEFATVSGHDLVGEAVRSRSGIDGLFAPDAAHLALLAAAHSWSDRPFAHLRDLVDLAVLLPEATPLGVDDLAKRLGVGRWWRMHRRRAEALASGEWPWWGHDPWTAHIRGRWRERRVGRYVARSIGAVWSGRPDRTARFLSESVLHRRGARLKRS